MVKRYPSGMKSRSRQLMKELLLRIKDFEDKYGKINDKNLRCKEIDNGQTSQSDSSVSV